MRKITNGVFYETSYPGVTVGGIVSKSGTLIIDTPLRQEDGLAWRAAMLNQRSSTQRLLVNLNAHLDRTLGARAIETTAVIAHAEAAKVIRNRPTIFKGQSPENGAEWEIHPETLGSRWAIPTITFTKHIELHWGDFEITLEHHPGPSPDAIWVILPQEKIVFVGDTVMPYQPPFLHNAELEPWIASLDLLSKSFKDYIIVGGRGEPMSSDAARRQRSIISNIIRKLKRLEKRAAPPSATANLVKGVLSGFEFPTERTDLYIQRLQSGLYQFYSRYFMLNNAHAENFNAET